MLECIAFISTVLGRLLIFIGNIRVDSFAGDTVTIAKLVFMILPVALIFGFLLGKSNAGGDTYQPRHAYLPRHGKE